MVGDLNGLVDKIENGKLFFGVRGSQHRADLNGFIPDRRQIN